MLGFFITFEGGEGTGKTTQINLLYDYLKSKNLDVLVTKEPGGSAICEKIRTLILAKEDEKLVPLTELFLYLADRAHHVKTVILPALKADKIVICDRYTDSTLVYQGYGRSFDIDALKNWNNLATENLSPNITFVLDIDPVVGFERIKTQRGINGLDRMELETLEFHKRIRNGYLLLIEHFPERIKTIDASNSIDEIHGIIKKYLRFIT